MGNAMSQVFKFISKNPGYRPSLGVITSVIQSSTMVAWGAINKDGEVSYVPALEEMKKSWPDATWTPISKQQASLFDKAFERERGAREEFLLSI